MLYDAKENIRRNVAVLILGDTKVARRLALKLAVRYGILSYICSYKCGFLTAFNPVARFYRISPPAYQDIILTQLDHIADQYNDCLKVLVSVSDEYRRFVNKCKDTIEERFILTSADKIERCIPFSLLKRV